MKFVFSFLVGYLLGNFQTSVLLSRLVYQDDVRRHGSGNAGTTNMLRVFGIGPGGITFAGDFIKGALAVLIGRWIAGETGGYLCGLAAVLGHDFPVLFGFRGGKGVASTLGIAWIISPWIAAVTTVVTFGLIFWSKMVSLGSLVGTLLFFVISVIAEWGNTPKLLLEVALVLLIFLRHTDNIRRLLKGEESKLMQRKSPATERKDS